MKTLTRVLAVVLLTASLLTAQNSPQFGGRIFASQYGKYQIGGETITTASGSATLSFAPSKCSQLAGNRPFIPFTTSNPLKIVDANSANTETVTPSAVSVTASTCSFTATFSNAHASYYVTSGTGGLQEAITDNAGTGGVIVLDPLSTTTTANITAATGGVTKLAIEDIRSGSAVTYLWNGTAFAAIGPQYLTGSAYTNASTTFSNVTGLAFPVSASANMHADCVIMWQGSASTTGPKYQFTGPASPTAVQASATSQVTASTFTQSAATAFSTAMANAGTITTATNFVDRVSIGILNGTTGGTVQLQAAANGAGTLTIQPGSYCIVQ